MHVEVEGTRLWFDVDGPKLVPDGSEMRERPTVVLLHGGPGSFDHSYLKPNFGRLAEIAQIVFGHSLGGFVALLYGARHPGHARALVLQSALGRFDLERAVEDFRRRG